MRVASVIWEWLETNIRDLITHESLPVHMRVPPNTPLPPPPLLKVCIETKSPRTVPIVSRDTRISIYKQMFRAVGERFDISPNPCINNSIYYLLMHCPFLTYAKWAIFSSWLANGGRANISLHFHRSWIHFRLSNRRFARQRERFDFKQLPVLFCGKVCICFGF